MPEKHDLFKLMKGRSEHSFGHLAAKLDDGERELGGHLAARLGEREKSR
jgi:hypothetical protein